LFQKDLLQDTGGYKMLGSNTIRKTITVMTAVAVWCVYSMVTMAAPGDITGQITVTGQVTVNGQAAVSNSTIASGAIVTTGANSSAVVSLGKLGRVEVSGDSSVTLKFSEGSIIAMMSTGKVRVSNNSGVATTVTTKDATVIGDVGQANSFAVEVECSHTHVDTGSGLVTMREGTSDKQVAAGTTATAGNMSQAGCKPCMRPGTGQAVPIAGIGSGAIALLLLGLGGAATAAILLGSSGNDVTVGGGGTVISPVR
jgi:hypothetical protein